MKYIETEYKTLSEIDPEIVKFYKKEEGKIVLCVPTEITFERAENERYKGWADSSIADDYLEQAITFEYFEVNHDEYLQWLEVHAEWKKSEDGTAENEPKRPLVQIEKARKCYEITTEVFDANFKDHNGEHDLEHNDVEFKTLKKPVLTDRDPKLVKEWTDHLAKSDRNEGQVLPIEVNGKVFDADMGSFWKLTGAVSSFTALVNDTELKSKGAVQDGKLMWTLADNTNTPCTKTNLQAVVNAIAIRAAKLQLEYVTAKTDVTA